MASGILGLTSDVLLPEDTSGVATSAALAAETSARESADSGRQPLDADLTALAALTTTAFGRALLTLASASAARTSLGVVPGTDVQVHDTDLDAIAALTTTSFGRELLTAASAGALLTTLGGLAKPADPSAYTQTFSSSTRTHAAAELPTTLTGLLLTELIEQLNTTNKAVNEVKKLANGIVDDLQASGLAK